MSRRARWWVGGCELQLWIDDTLDLAADGLPTPPQGLKEQATGSAVVETICRVVLRLRRSWRGRLSGKVDTLVRDIAGVNNTRVAWKPDTTRTRDAKKSAPARTASLEGRLVSRLDQLRVDWEGLCRVEAVALAKLLDGDAFYRLG